MNVLSPREQLQDVLHNGVMKEIFRVEQALALEDVIGKNATSINKLNFGTSLGPLQIILIEYFYLVICKIYEKSHPKYDLRSIPVALKILEVHAEHLHIEQRPYLISELNKIGLDEEELNNCSDKEITKKIVQLFLNRFSSKEFLEALEKIKKFRDKVIAHPEKIKFSDIPQATYSQFDYLVERANEFLIPVARGYLTSNIINDPKKASRNFKRLLKEAEIIEQ